MDLLRVGDRADPNAASEAEIEMRGAQRDQPPPLHPGDDVASGVTQTEPPQADVAHEAHALWVPEFRPEAEIMFDHAPPERDRSDHRGASRPSQQPLLVDGVQAAAAALLGSLMELRPPACGARRDALRPGVCTTGDRPQQISAPSRAGECPGPPREEGLRGSGVFQPPHVKVGDAHGLAGACGRAGARGSSGTGSGSEGSRGAGSGSEGSFGATSGSSGEAGVGSSGGSGRTLGTGASVGSTSMTRRAGPIFTSASSRIAARRRASTRGADDVSASEGTPCPLGCEDASRSRQAPDPSAVAEVQASVDPRLHRDDALRVGVHDLL
jgi:hypothetical protein